MYVQARQVASPAYEPVGELSKINPVLAGLQDVADGALHVRGVLV